MQGFGGFGTGSTGGGLFGNNKLTNTPAFGAGFGTPASTGTGLTFGTNTFGSTGTSLFGQPQQQSTPFGTAGTAATSSGTGFAFGTQNTTLGAPTFGSLATTSTAGFGTSTPSFGAPANVAPFGTGATSAPFGTATSSAPFGTLPTASTPFSAGTTGSSTTPFGTGTTAPSFGTLTGSSTPFGATTTAAPAFGGIGSNLSPFGTTTGTTPLGTSTAPLGTSTGLTPFGTGTGMSAFGTTGAFGIPKTTTTATPALNFGTPTTTTAAAAASATSSPFSFGLQKTTTAPAATTTTTGLGFGLTFTTTTAPTTTSSVTTGGLSFGTTLTPGFTAGAVTTTSASTGLNFGLPTTTVGFSLGGSGTGLFAPKTDTTTSLTTATTTTNVGLGGVDNSQTRPGLAGTGTLEPKQVKDNLLPDPVLQSLNEFQNFTKQQKSISVEISHGSSKPLRKVQEDTEALESLLATITSGLTRNAIAVDKLKTETAQGLHQAEMAQRNHETPPGIDYDNSGPAEYFNDLVTKFETDTIRLRVQIEASEKHLKSLTQSSTISPQELTLAMKRLHETLIVLAARVQTLHTAVQSQKEQYKNLRRVYFKDDSNIFDQDPEPTLTKKPSISSLRSLTGPTPFSETPGTGANFNVDGLAMLTGSTVTSAVPTTANQTWMTPLQSTSNPSSFLSSSSNVLTTPSTENASGFQLSKPPAGNKRNKR